MSKQGREPLPEWENVLTSASRLQRILPDAVLVGGTASAIYAKHRMSVDADHVLTDLRQRFDDVLTELESIAGWKTARIQRPVQILGSLDGIETGIRQLMRDKPLETERVNVCGVAVKVPTLAEILRIKGVLILKRNATRDYLDFAALSDSMGEDATLASLESFDNLYKQENNESPIQQLQIQLAHAMPYDLDGVDLSEYKNLDARWHQWTDVQNVCTRISIAIFDYFSAEKPVQPREKFK